MPSASDPITPSRLYSIIFGIQALSLFSILNAAKKLSYVFIFF